MSVTLWRGDCLKLMRDIPDGSIDCIITDPPYKMNHTTGGCTNIGMKSRWQGNIKAGNAVMGFDLNTRFSEWLPEAYRVLKDKSHCYVFCNDKNLQELLNETTKAGFRESNILVWVKNNACPNRYYMKNCEFVVFLYKGHARPINNMGSKAAFDCLNISGRVKNHPTEKPTQVLENFVSNSTRRGDLVLDMFMGSGSTGVACVNIGRSFIGIELDEKYFEIAKGRIEQSEHLTNRRTECF